LPLPLPVFEGACFRIYNNLKKLTSNSYPACRIEAWFID
jgi:hypothetical protein